MQVRGLDARGSNSVPENLYITRLEYEPTQTSLVASMATLVAQRAAETGATNVPVPVVWGKG